MSFILLKNFAYSCLPPSTNLFLKKIQSSDVWSRLAAGVFWTMAGAVLSRGLMLCATVIVARVLGKEVYGEIGMIQSTVGMVGSLAGFGLGLTATKHVAEFRRDDPERASRIIGLSGLFALLTGGMMGVVLLIYAPWLALHTLNAPHLAGALRVGALILFLNALNGTQTGALAGFEAFKIIAYVNLIVGLISFPILVSGARFFGLGGVVWALAINLCFNWFLNRLALLKEARRHNIRLTFQDCTKEWPVLLKFSFPAAISGVMFGPVTWICNTIIVKHPNGYGEMGIFTATLVFQQLLMFANGMLNAPLLSMLSNYGNNKNTKLESANILSSWLLGVMPALLFLCFPEIVEIIYGGEYAGSTFRITFSLVLFYTCILTYRAGLLRVLQSKSLLWWGVCNNLLWACLLIPATFYFAKWGSVGLSLAFAIAYIITSIVFVPVYMKFGEVSRGLLLSKEVLIVWLIVVLYVCFSILNISIVYRALSFPISIYLVVLSIKKIWIKNTK